MHRPRSYDAIDGQTPTPAASPARRRIRAPGRWSTSSRSPQDSTRATGRSRHCETVACYAETIARELELPQRWSSRCGSPGCCTTSARSASPDRSSASPARSTRPSGPRCRTTPGSAPRFSAAPGCEDIREWVHAHHERPDGAGYPRGLHDEEIPLEAKILAVADSYEAMTNDRCLPRRRSATSERSKSSAQRRHAVRRGRRRGVPRSARAASEFASRAGVAATRCFRWS